MFYGSLFQRKGVKERYGLTVVTCLHVHTPQAGYLATFGKVWQGLARFGKVWQGLARFQITRGIVWRLPVAVS
ncbi:hypothetical protein [Arsenophonus sp.]|uniref:hypothetical protein n=1 Tax=Arsenophonus sp. TaxID=1872640 RepID=UPI0028576BA4|nr:hypothetical protein [Arsenophonus sp.]MDR5611280.1 hypothetical protein [Arsenophonus sp.]MDR5615297.1 hypothetical protein [Arsenophonus sp.]